MTAYRCLILSHAFNMDGRAASQTITDKVPYLLDRGWKLFVYSAATGQKDLRFDHRQLFAWGPAAFRFDFRHWCALRFGRGWRYRLLTSLMSMLALPFVIMERALIGLSSQWSWAIPAVIRGVYRIKTSQINLIYSTGGAWSAHLAGWCLKKWTGVTWIAEIHDPMVERDSELDDGQALRRTREARFRQRLERMICADADLCWWFTEGALHYANARNPALGSKGFFVLPGAQAPASIGHYRVRPELHISHFGSLSRSRSLSSVIRGLSQFFDAHPQAIGKIKLHVYGSSLDPQSQALVQTPQLTDAVIAHGRLERDAMSGKSGRDQIAQCMQESDYLLLLHGDQESCAEYIPSKLYEYWWASRPILAVTHRNPQLDALIESMSPANFVCHVQDADIGVLRLFEYAWTQWASGKISAFANQRSALSPEDAVNHIMRSLANLSPGDR